MPRDRPIRGMLEKIREPFGMTVLVATLAIFALFYANASFTRPWRAEAAFSSMLLLVAASVPWLRTARHFSPGEDRAFYDHHPFTKENLAHIVHRQCLRRAFIFAACLVPPGIVWLVMRRANAAEWTPGFAGIILTGFMTVALGFLLDSPPSVRTGARWEVRRLTRQIALGVLLVCTIESFDPQGEWVLLDQLPSAMTWINPLAWPLHLTRNAPPATLTWCLLIPSFVLAALAIPLWRRRVPVIIAKENPWVTGAYGPVFSDPSDEEDFEYDETRTPDPNHRNPDVHVSLPVVPETLFSPALPDIKGYWERLIHRWFSPEQKLLCAWAGPDLPLRGPTLGDQWLRCLLFFNIGTGWAVAAQAFLPSTSPLVDIFVRYTLLAFAAFQAGSRLFATRYADGYPFALLPYRIGHGTHRITVYSLMPLAWEDLFRLRLKPILVRSGLLAAWLLIAAALLQWVIKPPFTREWVAAAFLTMFILPTVEIGNIWKDLKIPGLFHKSLRDWTILFYALARLLCQIIAALLTLSSLAFLVSVKSTEALFLSGCVVAAGTASFALVYAATRLHLKLIRIGALDLCGPQVS